MNTFCLHCGGNVTLDDNTWRHEDIDAEYDHVACPTSFNPLNWE